PSIAMPAFPSSGRTFARINRSGAVRRRDVVRRPGKRSKRARDRDNADTNARQLPPSHATLSKIIQQGAHFFALEVRGACDTLRGENELPLICCCDSIGVDSRAGATCLASVASSRRSIRYVAPSDTFFR